MKENSVTRRVDDLGRFVLPKDVRKRLNIRTGDYLELLVEGDIIKMRKYSYIKDLEYLVSLIIEGIYELYKVESILIHDKKVMLKRERLQEAKITKLMSDKEYLSASIKFEGKEIGEFIILSKDEKMNIILELTALFLKKYLE